MRGDCHLPPLHLVTLILDPSDFQSESRRLSYPWMREGLRDHCIDSEALGPVASRDLHPSDQQMPVEGVGRVPRVLHRVCDLEGCVRFDACWIGDRQLDGSNPVGDSADFHRIRISYGWWHIFFTCLKV